MHPATRNPRPVLERIEERDLREKTVKVWEFPVERSVLRSNRTVEGWIIHHAGFTSFEPFRTVK